MSNYPLVDASFSPVIFVNVNTQCNVDCKRCYIGEDKRYDKTKNKILKPEYLTQLLRHEVFQKHPPLVIYEGGETVLVGKEMLLQYVEAVRAVSPQSKQTMVTNLFSLPGWVIDFVRYQFDGKMETTFALGQKRTLGGSEPDYIKHFKSSLASVWDAGLSCPVNVELNRETVDAGVDALFKLILESGCKEFDFDYSLDFHNFLQFPVYDKYGQPKVRGTITHQEQSDYIIELHRKHGKRMQQLGIFCGSLHSPASRGETMRFNVNRSHEFFTLNPDGTVTTQPLYSDLPLTYIGDLNTDSVDSMLHHPRRLQAAQSAYEHSIACADCQYHDVCKGGPSHVPLYDKSNECAGGKQVWEYFENLSS